MLSNQYKPALINIIILTIALNFNSSILCHIQCRGVKIGPFKKAHLNTGTRYNQLDTVQVKVVKLYAVGFNMQVFLRVDLVYELKLGFKLLPRF